MHNGHLARVEQRLERRQPRVQPEEPIEIDRGIRRRAWFRDGERRPCGVVITLAERHDHVQAVDCATLENRNQHAPAGFRRRHGARQERRSKAKADERKPAVLHEDASRDHGVLPSLEFGGAEQ